MSSPEIPAAAPERVVAAAALLSWAVPFLALTLVGFSEQGLAVLGVSREALVGIAEISAVVGLAFGVTALIATRDASRGALRRRALLGTGASLVIVLVTQIASVVGAVSGRQAELELAAAVTAATHDYSGWNGGARLKDGAGLYAIEVDAGSTFAALALRQHRRAYRMVLLGADNRAGSSDLSIDLTGARAAGPRGATVSPVLHAEMRDPDGASSTTPGFGQPGTLRIPRGGTYDGAIVLFPPDESFTDVRWLELRVNGQPRRIPGKFFTLAEKRAIEAARSAGKPR